MKRTLSAILALCMFVAMLPTFSISMAAEATPFTVDFRTVDTSTLGGTNNAFLVEGTKGANWSVNADETTLRMGADIKFNIQYSPFADFQTWSTTGKVTFDFAVPADGKYNVDVYGMRRDAGGLGKFYIDGVLIGEEDFYAATNDLTNAKKKELNAVSLTEGTHKLTIEVAGKTGGSYNLLLVQRLDFTPVGAEEKPSEFVLDFSKVNTATLNGQYAKPDTTVTGPNWSLDTTVSGGSTAFGNSSPVRFYLNSYMQLGLYANQVNLQQDTIIINFDVPVAGKYDISGYFRRNTAGGYGDIYVDGVLQKTYDFYASANADENVKINEAPIELTKGTHKIKLTGRFSQITTHAYVNVHTFTFTPVVEEEPEEFVVDFTKVDKTTLGESNGQFAVRGTNVKGPNWTLLAHESKGSTIFNKGSRVRFYTDSYLQFGAYATDVASGYDSLVFEFTVPNTSFYDISGLFVKTTAGGIGDIYIDGVLQKTYDFYASATATETVGITKKPIELTAGTHKIKLTTKASQSETYAYMCMHNFTFTPAEEAKPPVLASAELSYGKRYILLSDMEGKKLTLSAKYDDGEAIDVWESCEVSFKSSNDTVATVSNDGIVKPLKAGNVTITATVKLGDVTKEATLDLIISEEPVLASYIYDFTKPSNSDIYSITFESDGWRINKSKSDSWVVNTANIVRFQKYGIQAQISGVEARNDLALDINVGESGIYDMTFVYDRYASGGIAYLYMDGIYAGEIDTQSAEAITGVEKKLRPMQLSKGAHTVQIKAIGRADGSAGANVYPVRIELQEIEELPALSSVKISAKDSLFVGETGTAVVAYVFENGAEIEARNNFDGKPNPGDSFAVSSSSSSVTVSGANLTAAAEGSADITASATVGGVTKTSDAHKMTIIKPVLESVKVSAPKYILLSDEDGEAISVSALYNSGKSVDITNEATLSFVSSDNSVATVSGEGVVTPVAAGEVTITTNITVDGVTLTDETKIIIAETPVYENFVIDFKNQTAATAYEATIETNGWQLNKSKSDAYLYSTRSGTDITRYQSYGLQIQSGAQSGREKISFDFNVQESGAYNIEFKGATGVSGGAAYLYIDGLFVGEYDFYSALFNADGEIAKIRPIVLSEGMHTFTLFAKTSPTNPSAAANMYPAFVRFTGTGELDPIAEAGAEMERKNIAAGESEAYSLYIRHASGGKYFARPSLDGTNEISLSMTSGDSSVATVENGFVKAQKSGVAEMTVSGKVGTVDVSDTFDFTVNDSTFDHVEIDVVFDEFYEGGITEISANAYLSSGEKINPRDYTVRFESDNTEVASIEGNNMSTKLSGNANITVYVTFNGAEKSASTKINVVPVALASISAKTEDTVVSAADVDGSKLIVTGKNNDGSNADLSDAIITYESLNPEIVAVTDEGYVISLSRGAASVKVIANLGGVEFEYIADVISSSQKTEPSLYTYEMRENAKDNIKKYAWAKEDERAAIQEAEYWVENFDEIYDLIMYEGIPRASVITLHDDPNPYNCIYCGEDIRERNNSYGWEISPLTKPFKIGCPNCKRLFPSNDFESFYKLGLDQKGQFNRERALEKHEELFGGTYGIGYLENTLYKEVGTTLGVPPDEVATWGVDDGFGWDTGEKASTGLPIKKTFIAFYHHKLYNANSKSFLSVGLGALTNAYLYTGNIKYGRAGAILIDRIADIYPSMDLNQYPAYQNSHGGRNTGKILGSIWETDLANVFIRAYDAFYPAMDDPQVISYLSKKAAEFGLENPKTSGDMIRENCENGIVREVFKAATEARILGNFGMHQMSVTLAAVALDTFPETAEMLEWMGKEQKESSKTVTYLGKEFTVRTSSTGADMLTKFVNVVDRDGFGDEIGAGYNQSWLTNSLNVVETLYKYGKYEKFDLYANPKYRKMFDSIIYMTMAGDYTLQLGDAESTASIRNLTSSYAAMYAYERLGDPRYAQILYRVLKGNLDNVYTDIFEKDAEGVQKEVEQVVKEYGELELKSRNLTGFGLAVLSNGKLVKTPDGTPDVDMRGDSWLWYGKIGGHGHNDMLQMGIDAYGFNFTPDLGYPAETGYDANRLQWIGTGLSHNVVTVNGKECKSVNFATPLHYDGDGNVRLIDVDASNAYDETDIYRRTLVSVDASSEVAYTVDFFRILGGDEHVYSFHTQSCDGVTVDGLNLVAQVDENGEYVGSYAGADVEYGPDPDTKEAWTYDTKYPRGYTWLKNVRRDEALTDGNFSVNFKQTDFKNQVSDSRGLNLKFTALNDWTPSAVGIAAGEPPRRVDNKMIPHLDYMLIHNTGKNLDTLYTSVIQPYKGEEYIESMESVQLVCNGEEAETDVSKGVKVKLKSGRTDYIIYATNNSLTYTLTDGNVSFDFCGFIGVYSVNEAGKNIYSYVNDGSRYTGEVVSFTEDLVLENEIVVKLNEEVSDDEIAALAGNYVYIDGDGTDNAVYEIKSAARRGDDVALNIGDVSLIKAYKNSSDLDAGYLYNISAEKKLYIPLSVEVYEKPVINEPEDTIASAGSSVVVQITAESSLGEKLTYIGTVMPRGAAIDEETGKITWKPSASQIGENGFFITVRDESGREAGVGFEIAVYGSTTGGTPQSPSEDNDSDDTTIPGTSDGNGGIAGGGGTGAPSTPTTPGGNEGEETNVRFIDLGNHTWAADSINALADEGIIKGTSHNTYSPAKNITRADFAILLVRAFELASDDTTNFDDVLSSDYFASELAIARNTGIVNGIGDNKYAPRNTITRQDMMVIVYRALTKLGVELEIADVEYEDFADVADYAKDAVKALITSGLINGKSGKIAPTDYTTRAEVAVLLKRILDYLK